jgi:hypothetical protein
MDGTNVEAEGTAQALFNDLVRAGEPGVVMDLFRGRVPILMWYHQGDIQLATYVSDDGGTVTGEDISPERAVGFLAPEGAATEQITQVASTLGKLIQSNLAANGDQYHAEAEDVRARIFPLPLSDESREKIAALTENLDKS